MANLKSSPKPRYRPGSLETEEKGLMSSPRPKLKPSEDEVRYVDAVFRGEDGDIITSPDENNPVTMLGLTKGDTFRQYPKNDLNALGAYMKPSDEVEGGPTLSNMQEFYSKEKPDSPPVLIDDIVIMGKLGVEDRYTAAHEFMHRGFNILRTNHSFDEIEKRFGRGTAQILFSEDGDYEHALVQSILEKEGKIAGVDYVGNDYLKGVSKKTRDKLKKSVEDIYELANETLGEAGYQTDRDRGPTKRLGKRGAKPKSFWSFITEKLGFAEGGLADQMDSMLPAADTDTRSTNEYLGKSDDEFNPLQFAKESWESAKERFMDAGITEVDANNPALYNAYLRSVDYLKDTGLAGLELIDAAARVAIGAVGEVVTGDDQTQKRFQRDIYSMPDAFAGMVGTKSISQLDDAIESAAGSGIQAVEKAKDVGYTAYQKAPAVVGDIVGQTRAAFSGDKDFGTTSDVGPRPLSAGFTGDNPPTYLKRDVPLSQQNEFELDYFGQGVPTEKKNLERLERVKFREPIKEFTEKLIFTSSVTNSFPKKGMLGSEFLRLLEKNAESIPPSSYKEGLVDRNKRYTKEELLDAVTKGENVRPGDNYPSPSALYYSRARMDPSSAYSQYQRQKKYGFQGGLESDYFVIPIEGTTKGTDFKANSQHFGRNTIAHVRGSVIDPMVGFNNNIYLGEDFKNLVGQKPYVLVEEIQSDLLQRGYVKPKDPFEAAFSATVKDFNTTSEFTFDEAYGDITKEFKKTLKELDSLEEVKEPQRLMSVNSPDNTVFKEDKEEKYIEKIKDKGYTTFEELKNYIDEQGTNDQEIWGLAIKLERERRLGDWFTFEIIDEKTGKIYDNFVVDYDNPTFSDLTEDFTKYMKDFGLDRDSILDKYEDQWDKFYENQKSIFKKSGLDKDISEEEFFNFYSIYSYNADVSSFEDIALPPIRKNKQAVEEALKTVIAKAAKEGVTKIVIPPAEKIAEARSRTLVEDKGDRFYRTYVTDLNQVLNELSQNYPVTVHRNIELPYRENRKSVDDVLNEYGVWNPDDDIVDADFEDPQDMERMLGDALRQRNREAFNALNLDLNDPSLYVVDDPVKGTVLDISQLVEEYRVEEPRQFAEGGAVGNMNEQMSFAFEDGGLRDDGMGRDPVSGNEVPSGSMAKEVRDDIPAQLSEGEYVVPADVVRYYGVKFFEDLRDDAKMGLQDMEMNGRIGGEPVPAGGPTEGGDLTPEEMAALQEVMGMADGGFVDIYKQQQNLYQPPNAAVGNSVQMARGSEVRGYAPGGLSADAQQTQNQIYAAGQQAQQAGFTGFPLGSTIFPTQAQIAAGQTTPTQYGTTQQPVSDFQPVALINTKAPYDIITVTNKAIYDQKIAEGYVLNDGSFQAPTYDDGSDYRSPPPPEPVDFSKMSETELTEAYSKNMTMGRVSLALMAFNPLIGTAANIAAKKQKELIEKAMKVKGIEPPKETGNIDVIDTIKNFFSDLLGTKKEKTTTAIPTTTTTSAKNKSTGGGTNGGTGGGDDKPVWAGAGRIEGASAGNVGNLSGTTTAAKTAEVKKATASVKKGPAASEGAKTASTASGGTTAGGANLDTAMGITGLNKGGLMTKGKKKK